MKSVTVYQAFSSADAHLICSRLKAAGLHAEVTNELSALSIEGYSQAAGGILVQVPEDEAVQARELITDPGTDHPDADEENEQAGSES